MDDVIYTPTKITLTRKVGFTREAARALLELSRKLDRDPRALAAELLSAAIIKESEANDAKEM